MSWTDYLFITIIGLNPNFDEGTRIFNRFGNSGYRVWFGSTRLTRQLDYVKPNSTRPNFFKDFLKMGFEFNKPN
jgi:hypothetical protein